VRAALAHVGELLVTVGERLQAHDAEAPLPSSEAGRGRSGELLPL
jgi:hypothetical protein